MQRIRLPLFTTLMVLAIAACGGRDPVARDADGEGLPDPASETAASPAGGPRSNEAQPTSGNATGTAGMIPAALHGRWGLTPADCMSTGGDEGLLTVTEGVVRFYESEAVPTSNIQADADSISGRFRFTGEGQTWEKYQALQVRGNMLIRTETNPAASYTYAKC